MIIAVDYDGTLWRNNALNMPLVADLMEKQAAGHIVILWTCRNGKRLSEALAELRRVGFLPHFVNENAPHICARFGYNPRKIYADVYIDDKNVIIQL